VRFRRFLTWAWVTIVIAIFVLFISDPSRFAPEALQASLAAYGGWSLPVFLIAGLFHGVVLVPSTPVVIAGGAMYPDSLPWVFVIIVSGIVISASVLYRFPRFAGYDKMLAAKYPEQLQRLQDQLRKPRAIWFVAGWAFFPAVPTELVCYAAGLVGMPFRRMLLGIIIGEVPIVIAYLFLGSRLSGLLPF
jgi:uncharacterized membrane protein YdjX (TVP38/TMEM64 family)